MFLFQNLTLGLEQFWMFNSIPNPSDNSMNDKIILNIMYDIDNFLVSLTFSFIMAEPCWSVLPKFYSATREVQKSLPSV